MLKNNGLEVLDNHAIQENVSISKIEIKILF